MVYGARTGGAADRGRGRSYTRDFYTDSAFLDTTRALVGLFSFRTTDSTTCPNRRSSHSKRDSLFARLVIHR